MNYWIGDLPTAAIAGSSHLILSFIESSTSSIPQDGDNAWLKYAVGEFANLDEDKRKAFLSMMRVEGTKVMASVGGAAASHTIYKKYDPTAFGVRAAKYIVDLGLDGLDIDLEGWGNDPDGTAFLKSMTAGAFNYFSHVSNGKKYVITHAPEMPDFWKGLTYAELMTDREAFDMIDFLNVQFYNQLQFPSSDYVFVKDIYDPAVHSPSSLGTIAKDISQRSNGKISQDEATAKLLLGFPCKDGSFPVGSKNLNQCGAAQFNLVKYGVDTLHYPLAGVFEWTQSEMTGSEIADWNTNMRQVIEPSARNTQSSNEALLV